MSSSTSLDLFLTRSDRFAAVLGGVHDWDAPSPCEGWSVRDVVDHVVGTEREFVQRHDLPLDDLPPADDPASLWRAHLDAVVGAVSDELGREFDGYFGPTTIGATLSDFYGWDLAVHAWDIAVASGQPSPISDADVTELSAAADGWGDALYSEGVCGSPVDVPDDASPTDRLLGRLGRDPRWGSG